MKLSKLSLRYDIGLKDLYSLLEENNVRATDIFLKEITVGHTYFFREREHFKILVNDIIKDSKKDTRIWCAASSSGEEPYSISICLLEKNIRDFKILSTDINKKALEIMNKEEFSFRQHQRIEADILKKYFKKTGNNSYKIRPDLRSHLFIKQLNLHGDIRLEKAMDYIFCRNVMIYFDDRGRKKVLKTLLNNLKKDGLLFVGLSEAILDLPPTIKKVGPAVYRKVH